MPTTKRHIRGWLHNGRTQGATHLIVAYDTFDHEDYPVFVMPGEDPHKKAAEYRREQEMSKVMEVYALHLDWDMQLNECRAFHYDAPPEPSSASSSVSHPQPRLAIAKKNFVEMAAKLTYEANRRHVELFGGSPFGPWEDALDWQQASNRAGVIHRLNNWGLTPLQSHMLWLVYNEQDGWKYGPVKDAELKTHPDMVPYEQLPPEERARGTLFLAVIEALLSTYQLVEG